MILFFYFLETKGKDNMKDHASEKTLARNINIIEVDE